MLIEKKGQLVVTEVVGFILAAVASVALITLIVILINPEYNQNEEIAKSYFDKFKKDINDLKKGDVMSFILLERGGDAKFYLVYFGDDGIYRNPRDDGDFVFSEMGENVVCVCYDIEGTNVCHYCDSFDFPLEYMGFTDDWIIGEGKIMKIIKMENNYVVS